MTRRSRGLGVLALVFSIALIAASCGDSKEEGGGGNGGGDVTTTTAARSDTCRNLDYKTDVPSGGTFDDYAQLSSAGDNTSFDPGAVQTLDEAQITNALFDGLTDFDFRDTCNPKLKGLVASKWESNADASEWTFHIKKGLVFSDGEKVLPSSFKIAWERFGSPELASAYGYLIAYIKGGQDLIDGKVKTLDSIKADDDAMTLTVQMETPNADFPAIVTLSEFSPIAKSDYEKIGNKTGWGTQGITIGNGPFKLQSADSPDSGTVVLVPNDKWAGNVLGDKKAKLDKLVFHLTSDVDSAYQAFQSGVGDSATIPSGKYGDAQANYPNTLKQGTLGTYYFDIGFDDPQLGGMQNVKLRQAISMAIDRDEINQKVYEGTRTISTGITPPGIPGFKADLCKYCKTDVTAAKAAFKDWQDAGGKLTKPIKISFNTGGGHQDVAAIIQSNLKEVLGIDAELNSIDEDYFKVVAEEGACQLCRSGWYADYPTYGNFMVDLFSKASIGGNNFGRFDDPKFETLIADAQKEVDSTKRGDLYNQAEEELLNNEVGAIPLNWYTGDQVYREGAINYIQPPLGLILWEKVGKSA
jgi:ABC-type oligopeptide transport system substrate-binding subunit